MGIKFFDYDNDGRPDLFITDMHSDMSVEVGPDREKLKSRMEWTKDFLQGDETKYIFGNSFFHNLGNGRFEEVSDRLGVENYWPWGPSVGDLNADGWQDIFIASSMNYPWRYGINSLLLNNRGEKFLDSEFLLGIEPRRGGRTHTPLVRRRLLGAGHGAASEGCKGRPGKITVMATLGTRSSVMLRHRRRRRPRHRHQRVQLRAAGAGQQPGRQRRPVHWLGVALAGTASNRNGLGATVRVSSGGRVLTQWHDGKSGYLSQSVLPLYFGLGDAATIGRVEVAWPSGRKQVLIVGAHTQYDAARDRTRAAAPPLADELVTPLLEMRGISKAFPGVRALEDVSLGVQAGEVHFLLGQNGAGKSTLIRILCGAHRADTGEILVDGVPVRLRSPADARKLGIAVIFQEFSLVPYLNAAQNIYLGREPRGVLPGTVDDRRMHAEARRLLDALGLDLDTRTLVHELGIAQQQVVEIAKALSQNARILVMDEPTAALSDREIERLFDRVRTLKATGVAVIYISHRLQEIASIADRVTVLRDGRSVASMAPADGTVDELVHLMLGRAVETTYRSRFCERPGDVVLAVDDVSAENGVRAATLTVRAGEVVGLAGTRRRERRRPHTVFRWHRPRPGRRRPAARKAAIGTSFSTARPGVELHELVDRFIGRRHRHKNCSPSPEHGPARSAKFGARALTATPVALTSGTRSKSRSIFCRRRP